MHPTATQEHDVPQAVPDEAAALMRMVDFRIPLPWLIGGFAVALRTSAKLSRLTDPPLPPVCAPRVLPRYWFARLYVALSVLVNVVVTLLEPSALTARAINASGSLGWLAVWTLGAVGVVALLDVIVNDLAPDRWRLPSAHRWRHFVYMAIALGEVSITYVIAAKLGFTPLLFVYWLDAAADVAIAYFDLFARHREGRTT